MNCTDSVKYGSTVFVVVVVGRQGGVNVADMPPVASGHTQGAACPCCCLKPNQTVFFLFTTTHVCQV